MVTLGDGRVAGPVDFDDALDLCCEYDRSWPREKWQAFLLDLVETGQSWPITLALQGWDGRHRCRALTALRMPVRTQGPRAHDHVGFHQFLADLTAG